LPGQVFRDCADGKTVLAGERVAGDVFCGPEMVVIPPGAFRMGDLKGDGESEEKPVRTVIINYLFAAGKFEITGAAWHALMGGNPPLNRRSPVHGISWRDAMNYIRKLSAKTGREYRLFNEAEWEYVARAGTETPFHTGDSIDTTQASITLRVSTGRRIIEIRGGYVAPVGSFPANPFGVHDMHGNVSEWVADCYYYNYKGAPTDGSQWRSADEPGCRWRVVRGGSFFDEPQRVRSAARHADDAEKGSQEVGLRVARVIPR